MYNNANKKSSKNKVCYLRIYVCNISATYYNKIIACIVIFINFKHILFKKYLIIIIKKF